MSIEAIRALRRAVRELTPRGLLVLRAQQRHGFQDMGDEFWAHLSDDKVREIADAPETDTEALSRVVDALRRELAAFVEDVLNRPLPYVACVLIVAGIGGVVEALVKSQ